LVEREGRSPVGDVAPAVDQGERAAGVVSQLRERLFGSWFEVLGTEYDELADEVGSQPCSGVVPVGGAARELGRALAERAQNRPNDR
jgi:hypothetical protein